MYLRRLLRHLGLAVLLSCLTLIGTYTLHSTPTLADACNPQISITVPVTPAGASGNCDMSIATNLIGNLSFSNAASASTQTNVVAALGGSTAGFGFGTTVTDLRNTTDGWHLQAASKGLVNGSTVVPLQFLSSTSTCTPSGSQNTCADTTMTPVTLTVLPQTFLSAGQNGNHLLSGVFAIQTTGQYTFLGNAPTGAYSGIITISLVNTF